MKQVTGVESAVRVAAVEQIQALTETTITGFTAVQWRTESRAAGWTVHDVVAHMSSAVRQLFGPLMLKVARSKDIEGLNEDAVTIRRSWPDADLVAEYRQWAPRARRLLGLTQLPGVGAVKVPMAELGSFPSRVLPSAIVFDTYTHLYHDIAPALGLRLPTPAPAVITATLEWMMLVAAALGGDRIPLDEGQRITLRFNGSGSADWTLQRRGGVLSATSVAGGAAAATIVGAAEDFPAWGTHRRPWRECGLSIAGDRELGTRVLDAVRVV
ncbi:hypothetical protein TUM20985_42060 [Mycobacterium antarcticum]|uniref:maleylpyruvate isomerase N-terminal domain-containing protein n=1 Tax=Mycolicibacterium sp. TUM20985 TaxID=3023370 RepID=UPI0025744B6D|nr:maleylpyruvate isomerase N-terminal domain-containing protein [Mycolicibacterium sp. TUM20985]BDX33659.1 hypothetical protein TUM20985_42060 [Mycolicibacterium sp. TUM20985]